MTYFNWRFALNMTDIEAFRATLGICVCTTVIMPRLDKLLSSLHDQSRKALLIHPLLTYKLHCFWSASASAMCTLPGRLSAYPWLCCGAEAGESPSPLFRMRKIKFSNLKWSQFWSWRIPCRQSELRVNDQIKLNCRCRSRMNIRFEKHPHHLFPRVIGHCRRWNRL
jgi:hypothetical protein